MQSVHYYSGEGPVHRASEDPNHLVSKLEPELETLWKALETSFETYSSNPCLGYRPKTEQGPGSYVWSTYAQVLDQSTKLGNTLRSWGLTPKDKLGIFSQNRPEWIISALASWKNNIIVVPLYATLGPDAIEFIINHAEISTVVCGPEAFFRLRDTASKCHTLKNVILLDGPLPIDEAKISSVVKVFEWAEVMNIGASVKSYPSELSKPEDLFCIMYTSGTTGLPKGVCLSNRNAVSSLAAGRRLNISMPNDVHMSYLPLAHIFELMVSLMMLAVGGSIGYWRGDISLLMEDIQELKPTLLCGVPRVWNRIFDKIKSTLAQSSSIKRAIFNYAYQAKRSHILNGGTENTIWNKIVFSKMKDVLGGRVRLAISGAAPISSEVQEFLRICFCTTVLQGYGLTETCAMLTVSRPHDLETGHTGAPVTCCEVKLVDVPEMGYTSSTNPQRGEVCVRGNNIFVGYFKAPEITKEVLEDSGWFHTGDIGQWNENGTLTIIDRKKNLFKLAQGEYIAVEFLQEVYSRCNFIAQCFIYGDSLKDFLVMVAIPDPEILIPWAKQNGFQNLSLKSLCEEPRVKKVIMEELRTIAKNSRLKGFEEIKGLYLDDQPWTAETGELTPTLKMKRNVLKEKYLKIIDQMYQEIHLVPKSKL
eukprot:TRINITY_DN4560_c0_g1_i1.p1 TRINITY_DN4560_c0_g1~~TRINITY_DN4560_c0_g1_i1.p1  ORF type:complete len:646 (+),score=109.26 TRINITY_DN4560_c0_g1_i1:71-2008(+)